MPIVGSPRWLERLAPAALGRDFRWLLAASASSNLGDGVLRAAGPLLVTTLTREPITVASAVFLQELPWLIFGIPAGAIVDRVDRRRLAMGVDILRAVILGLLALSVLVGFVNLFVVLSVSFLLGTAEAFADIAGGALVATRVPKPTLGQANSRLIGTSILTNQLAGPSIGALLFAIGVALPFGVDAVAALAGAVLIGRMAPEPRDAAPSPSRTDPHPPGDRRRRPMALAPPPAADAGTHDLLFQRDVLGCVGRVRPARPRATRAQTSSDSACC